MDKPLRKLLTSFYWLKLPYATYALIIWRGEPSKNFIKKSLKSISFQNIILNLLYNSIQMCKFLLELEHKIIRPL